MKRAPNWNEPQPEAAISHDPAGCGPAVRVVGARVAAEVEPAEAAGPVRVRLGENSRPRAGGESHVVPDAARRELEVTTQQWDRPAPARSSSVSKRARTTADSLRSR